MRTANPNTLQLLLLSLALMAAMPLVPLKAQESPVDRVQDTIIQDNSAKPIEPNELLSPANADSTPLKDQIGDLQSRLKEIELRSQKNDSGPLAIAWPLWLGSGSGLIGLVALVLAILAFIRVEKQHQEILELRRKHHNLLSRISGVEVQMEQERVVSRSREVTAPAPKPTPVQQPQPPRTIIAPPAVPQQLDPQPSQGILWPAPAPSPAPVSKEALINSLNAGDRQPVREAATAELNITSESENSLAMGRAIATELEEVAGGGSYWLVMLQGQYWLFPTDRTLKGFSVAQPAKGLFQYEQQTIAQPRLIEPALLESSGTRWSVKAMGKVATP